MFVEFTDHWFPSRLVCVQQIPQISDQILLPFLCDTNPPLLSSSFGAWMPNISQSVQWESMWWQHWEILKRVVIYSFRSWVLVQISSNLWWASSFRFYKLCINLPPRRVKTGEVSDKTHWMPWMRNQRWPFLDFGQLALRWKPSSGAHVISRVNAQQTLDWDWWGQTWWVRTCGKEELICSQMRRLMTFSCLYSHYEATCLQAISLV